MKKIYYVCFVLIVVFGKNVKSQQTFYDINTIQQIEIFFAESNWRHILDSLKATNDGYLTSDSVRINGKSFPLANVKFKGNSSYDASFKKNPFTIKLDKNITQDYQGISSIKLSNIYQDPSVIREALAYHILSNYMHCSRANFAQVYVNGVAQGLFTNVEDVTKTFVASHFKSAKTNTLIKCNPVSTPGPNVKSNLKYINADSSSYANLYEMESTYGWNDLVGLCDAASNNTAQLNTLLDVDRMLWMLAYDNLLVNLDSYIGAFSQNYFMFKDNSGFFNPIVWDLNMCFGAFPYIGSSNTSLSALSIAQQKQLAINIHENDVHWPLIKALLANATYKRMYVAHIRTLVNEMFANNYYKTYAAMLQQTIDGAVLIDSNKFFTYDNFKNGLTADISLGNYTAPGIANLMDARAAYLQNTDEFTASQPVIANLNPVFSKVDSMFQITVKVANANAVFLGYRLNLLKKFTRLIMFDDGLHGDGAANDSVYGISLNVVPEQSQYYVYAENANAGVFSPQRAEHEYHNITLSTATSSFDIQAQDHLSVYPNPTSSSFTIKTTDAGSNAYEITNPLGKTMQQGIVYEHAQINTSNWATGIYIVRVGNSTQKICIK